MNEGALRTNREKKLKVIRVGWTNKVYVMVGWQAMQLALLYEILNF